MAAWRGHVTQRLDIWPLDVVICGTFKRKNCDYFAVFIKSTEEINNVWYILLHYTCVWWEHFVYLCWAHINNLRLILFKGIFYQTKFIRLYYNIGYTYFSKLVTQHNSASILKHLRNILMTYI